jgi:cytochrome c-type biogenesis protein CcmH/NrfF
MVRVALVSLVLLGCAPVYGRDAPSESRQAQSIVRNTASPFCPGKTLDSCPSPKAAEWRQDIHGWVAQGVPEPEIRKRLQDRVPGFDLSIPAVRWGWAIPAVAAALSTLWLLVMARRFRARAGERSEGAPVPRGDDLDARLEEELARLD